MLKLNVLKLQTLTIYYFIYISPDIHIYIVQKLRCLYSIIYIYIVIIKSYQRSSFFSIVPRRRVDH